MSQASTKQSAWTLWRSWAEKNIAKTLASAQDAILASSSLATWNAATFRLSRSTGFSHRIALFSTHGDKRTTARLPCWYRRQYGTTGRPPRLSGPPRLSTAQVPMDPGAPAEYTV